MADHQQKPAETAVGDQNEKPGEAAIGDHHQQQQQQPPGEVAARYTTEQVGEALAFLNQITARLEGSPTVQDELLDLLVGLGDGHGDRHAVPSRAASLLRDHPDVLDMFDAFLNGAAKPPVPPPDSLAANRPRRSSTSRHRRRRSSVPAEEKPDVPVFSGGEGTPPRKSKTEWAHRHEPVSGGDRALDDPPRLAEAIAFLKKVEEIAGNEALKKFVTLLGDARKDEEMDAGVIYRRAMGVLGAPEHGDLLHKFAITFLPGEEEWEAQQETRRRAAAAAKTTRRARAADDGGDGHRRQHGIHVAGSSGGEPQFETNVITLEIVKKRSPKRSRDRRGEHDGDHRRHDDSYATPVRNKKPHTHASVLSGSRAGAYVDKKARRRTANGGEGCSSAAAPPPQPPPPAAAEENDPNAMFRRFRELWEFYTNYSTMVETMSRAEELLDGDADGDDLPLTVEEMFPHRRHREFLQTYYADHWGKMKAKLEGDETTAAAALEAVLESLQRKEEEAVAEEVDQRRRRDVARAIERLNGLVMDMKMQEEERRRVDAGDGGAAGRHVGHRR